MLRDPTYFYIENIWHNFQLSWTEWGGWTLPFGVTCAWDRATHRLMTTYVTVFPYRYKLNAHSGKHTCCAASERLHALSRHNRCWTASEPRLVDLMQAAGGWRSCAEGVPTGQSAASASSVLSSEDHTQEISFKKGEKKSLHLAPPLANTHLPCIIFIDSFFRITWQKLPNAAQALHAAELKQLLLKSCRPRRSR